MISMCRSSYDDSSDAPIVSIIWRSHIQKVSIYRWSWYAWYLYA